MDEHKVNFSFNNSQFLLFRVNQLNEMNTHIESENNMLKRKIQKSDDIITEYQNNITILSSKLPEYANSNEKEICLLNEKYNEEINKLLREVEQLKKRIREGDDIIEGINVESSKIKKETNSLNQSINEIKFTRINEGFLIKDKLNILLHENKLLNNDIRLLFQENKKLKKCSNKLTSQQSPFEENNTFQEKEIKYKNEINNLKEEIEIKTKERLQLMKLYII